MSSPADRRRALAAATNPAMVHRFGVVYAGEGLRLAAGPIWRGVIREHPRGAEMHLSRFPRLRFAHLSTPLEPMERLSKYLGGPRLWIKRDDCTGLSTGGNKTRKLEFLMGDAVAKGADTIITQGATQSNHARQTAAAAAKFGMECHLLLEDRTGNQTPDYTLNGNVLLDRLHGASVSKRSGGADMNAEMEALASDRSEE